MTTLPVLTRCLMGTRVGDNPPVSVPQPLISLAGTSWGRPARLELGFDELTRGVLVSGATGSGKTVVLRQMAAQLQQSLGPRDCMVVQDAKDDYRARLARPGDLVLGQGLFRDQSVRWNLFEDLLCDGWSDEALRLNAMEFARQMFAHRKGEAQQFFPDAAKLLLSTVLLHFLQTARASPAFRAQQLSNAGLRAYFAQQKRDQFQTLLAQCEDPGVVRMLLGETGSPDNLQALGVLGEEVLAVLSTFCDVFGEAGDFSIRKFIRQKGGRTLFLMYDPAYKETQQQIFSLLVNLMLKEATGQRAGDGRVIFLCDELPAMGLVDLASAVNLGRAKGLMCLCGLQTVEQICQRYGEHGGRTLLAGLRTKLAFSPNDAATRAFTREQFGENVVEELVPSAGGCVTRRTTGHVVEDWDLNALAAGDCVCGLPDRPPFLFHVSMP